MKRYYLAVLVVFALAFSACAESLSSSMNFNSSLTHDEGGIKWTAYGEPVLSSAQSISGGKALFLDGNSYLQAEDTSAFDLPYSFTLEAWIYPLEFVTDHYGGATFTVFSRWLHGVRTLYLVNIEKADEDTGKLTFYTDFVGMMSIESKASVPLKKWTHIAVTRDAEKTMRLFVNGRLEAEKRFTQDFTSTDYPMTIGASSNAMRKSVGYIDDWRVYKSCRYTHDFTPSAHEKTQPAENNAASQPKDSSFSAADEIRKFKALLDEGIITQEEFNAAKRKLLGL